MYTLLSNRILLILLSACLLTSYVSADTVYKSIDKDGKITYSSSPAENHQETLKVNILPPPSEDDVTAAQQRHQQNLRADKIFDENRQKRSQKIAEDNRIKRDRKDPLERYQKPGKPMKEEGPYYGIPGHGILVLPGGPRINP